MRARLVAARAPWVSRSAETRRMVRVSTIPTRARRHAAVAELARRARQEWDTTCLNCSSLMHKNIAEYVRAEKAEERLAAVQEIADRGITGWDLTPTVSGNEDVTWWYDYLRALDNIWRTRVRAALGVTAPTASEAGDARCGCTVGGLHRYGCGLVGRVDGHPAPAEVSEVEGSDREVG